jgi:hypothetical protein
MTDLEFILAFSIFPIGGVLLGLLVFYLTRGDEAHRLRPGE